MHTYNSTPCSDCNNQNCQIPDKVKRRKANSKYKAIVDGCMGLEESLLELAENIKTEAVEANYGQAYPKVICLCGSTRFKDAYVKAMRDETLEGNIVLSVGMFSHEENIDMSGDLKKMLDQLHLRKIDKADEVLVLNVGGYIGSSH